MAKRPLRGENVPEGGLWRRQILMSVQPSDLPVEQVELVINLKTAKALSLTVPPIADRAPTRMNGGMSAIGT